MTNHPDDLEPTLRDALRDAAPSAEFDGGALRDRIDASIADRTRAERTRIAARAGRRPLPAVAWAVRAAAAALIFTLGAWYGRANAPFIEPVAMNAMPTLDATQPGSVPLSIQSAGTGYVASLAMLSEMRDRLTPEQREQARQVALAVLSGAIAELATAGDGRLPDGVLQTVLSYGVPAGGPADPVVRYR